MNKSLFKYILMSLALLFGVMPEISAADSLSIEALYIEPGETKNLALDLDSEVSYYGFQIEISLPNGLEFADKNDAPSIMLSSRVDSSYSIVTNLLNSRLLRIGAFSTTHTPIDDTSGALVFIDVAADDDFSGGALSLTNIHFVAENDQDVAFPDYSINIRNRAENICYISDFSIGVNQSETISLMLDNETAFTAFQIDIYLPEGMKIKEDSFRLSSRVVNHTVSTKSFGDGRVRLTCFSANNDAIEPGEGPIIEFDIYVENIEAGEYLIELKNKVFSTLSADEYFLPDSVTHVDVVKVLVSEIILNETSISINKGDTFQLFANVLPDQAYNKALIWTSSDESVATVQDGLVETYENGISIIRAEANDGSGIYAECAIEVGYNHDSGVVKTEADGISIFTEPFVATIHGIKEDTIIRLFDMSGTLIYAGNCSRIKVSRHGIYLLVVGNNTFEILL